mgnify:CR=1 FL=1
MERLHYNERLKRRAELKLKRVGDTFAQALGEHVVERTDGPMEFGMAFDRSVHVPWLQCRYDEQNRFFARSYDFVCTTDLPSDWDGEVQIELKYSGVMQIADCRFEASGATEPVRDLVRDLNHDKAREIVRQIDFLGLKIGHSPAEGRWHIESRTMIGSSTWAIMPPAFQTITPSTAECRALVDTFDLLAHTIRTHGFAQ